MIKPEYMNDLRKSWIERH